MTVDTRAKFATVVVNNGSTDLDVSAALEYLSLESPSWNADGYWSMRGTLRLAAYVDGFGESFDPRDNISRWKPENLVSVSVNLDGTDYDLPWLLQILRFPNRPTPQTPYIDIAVGSDFELRNSRSPEGKVTDSDYGTPTTRGALINSLLIKAGARGGYVSGDLGFALPYNPEKSDGGPYIGFAGKLAYSVGSVLWQDNSGDVYSKRLTGNGLSAVNHYTVGTNEADYELQGTLENAPEFIRAVGTSYELNQVEASQTFSTTETSTENYVEIAQGQELIKTRTVETQTTLALTRQGSETPQSVETVARTKSAVLGGVISEADISSPTSVIPETESTTVETYSPVNGTLTKTETTTRIPIKIANPATTTTNPETMVTASRETTQYYYTETEEGGFIVNRRVTTTLAAIFSGTLGTNVTLAPSKRLVEKWQEIDGRYRYSRSVQINNADERLSPTVTNNVQYSDPPATQFKPPAFSREENEHSSSVRISTTSGTGYGEKLQVITIPGGLCTSAGQCNLVANIWADLRQGRQFGIKWTADINPAWLEDFSPVRRVDFTLNGTRTAYLIDAFNFQLDKRSASVGGLGIEIGRVASDGSGTPTKHYSITLLLDGNSPNSEATIDDTSFTSLLDGDSPTSSATIDDATLTPGAALLNGGSPTSAATIDDAVLEITSLNLNGDTAFSTATIDDATLDATGAAALDGDTPFSNASIDDATLEDSSADTYRRPGGVDTYRRPGGTDRYLRP